MKLKKPKKIVEQKGWSYKAQISKAKKEQKEPKKTFQKKKHQKAKTRNKQKEKKT
jgi:hypothetical protein